MAKNDFLRRAQQRASQQRQAPPEGPSMVCWQVGKWSFFPVVPLQGFILGFQSGEVDDDEDGALLAREEIWSAVTLLTINGIRLDLDEEDSKAFLEQVASVFEPPSVLPATVDQVPPFPG